MDISDAQRGQASLPALGAHGPLRPFAARCRSGRLIVTGLTIEHGWVIHPLIADGGLVSGWTISEPASGCRIAYGCTIAETRAQLTARIAAMGGTVRFLSEIEKARATILGSREHSDVA